MAVPVSHQIEHQVIGGNPQAEVGKFGGHQIKGGASAGSKYIGCLAQPLMGL
jgi:hypothetical protein